jgi:hypothetical protein
MVPTVCSTPGPPYPQEVRDRAVRMVQLEENAELRRANAILKAASAFLTRELDRRLPK